MNYVTKFRDTTLELFRSPLILFRGARRFSRWHSCCTSIYIFAANRNEELPSCAGRSHMNQRESEYRPRVEMTTVQRAHMRRWPKIANKNPGYSFFSSWYGCCSLSTRAASRLVSDNNGLPEGRSDHGNRHRRPNRDPNQTWSAPGITVAENRIVVS